MAKKVFFVTGPIGSGKSTAVEYLKSKGFLTIDLDIISNEILLSTESENFLSSNFPEALSNYAIDKQKLANIVFQDSNKLKILEEFLHPKIQEKLLEMLTKTDQVVFVEISAPKKIESDIDYLVIFSDIETRKKRLLSRGMTINDIESRIKSQKDDDWWLNAGYTVTNKNLEQLFNDIDHFLKLNNLE